MKLAMIAAGLILIGPAQAQSLKEKLSEQCDAKESGLASDC
jgi:hypothetical protein